MAMPWEVKFLCGRSHSCNKVQVYLRHWNVKLRRYLVKWPLNQYLKHWLLNYSPRQFNKVDRNACSCRAWNLFSKVDFESSSSKHSELVVVTGIGACKA